VLFCKLSLGIRSRIQSEYVERPPMRIDDLSFRRGPSSVSLPVIGPIPPDAVNFFLFPSRDVTSITEDIRPPCSAGVPLLNSSTSFTTSGLKAEKNPNRWDGLKIVASS